METNHVWVVHVKQKGSDRSRETGWTPVFREYSEDSANNLANLVTGNNKSSQIKITKHETTSGNPGPTLEYSPEPVSEKFIGRFSRSPKPVVVVPRPKPAQVTTKDMTTEEKAHARRLNKMVHEARPHAKTATDRKRGK